jgi:hypothetical protein
MIGGAHLSAGRREGKGGAAGGVFPCGRQQSGRAPSARGRLGREGEMGRLRGRGPVGRGKKGQWKRKEDGPRLGRKAGWAESDGKILFRIKFDF